MQVEWTEGGRHSANEVLGYIAQFNEHAALALSDRISEVVQLLSMQPYLGRPGRVSGTREFVVHQNYILIYKIALDRIVISNIMHSRREYP
jgi:toxin ParE1/3/4